MIPGQAPANVRFTPNSGRKWVAEFMSAYDPKRTFVALAKRQLNPTLSTTCLGNQGDPAPGISTLATSTRARDFPAQISSQEPSQVRQKSVCPSLPPS